MAIIRRRKMNHGNPSETEPSGAPGAELPEDAQQEEDLAERLTDSVLHEDGYSRRRPKRRKIRVELIKEPAPGAAPIDNGSEPEGGAPDVGGVDPSTAAAAPADAAGAAGPAGAPGWGRRRSAWRPAARPRTELRPMAAIIAAAGSILPRTARSCSSTTSP